MNEAKVLLSIGFILLLGLLQIAFNAISAGVYICHTHGHRSVCME